MYCRNCGKTIDDKAVICPNCGVPQAEQKKPVNGFGVAGFIIGLLSIWLGYILFCIPPVIGIILSGIGCTMKAKCSANGLAVAGLVLSIVTLLLYGFLWLLLLWVIGSGATA